jgi:polyadenylation factor subunit 2
LLFYFYYLLSEIDVYSTVHLHKSSIFCCRFNPVNGNYLATGSKDFNVKLFDLRMMAEVECYKGHNREIVTLAWHPVHEKILVSGAYQGSMIFWHVGHPVS